MYVAKKISCKSRRSTYGVFSPPGSMSKRLGLDMTSRILKKKG
jgi:hypothetical protein